jgi:hypothetical protein
VPYLGHDLPVRLTFAEGDDLRIDGDLADGNLHVTANGERKVHTQRYFSGATLNQTLASPSPSVDRSPPLSEKDRELRESRAHRSQFEIRPTDAVTNKAMDVAWPSKGMAFLLPCRS